MTVEDRLILSAADIGAADATISPHIFQTPLLESARLNDFIGGRLLVKAECLQKTGSFKIRGALNKIASLSNDQRSHGVVAFSSGNHGQGVAAAARIYDTNATILMPKDSPNVKIESTRYYGAEVILYDRMHEDREAMARQLIYVSGATLIHPFDDQWVMAGQGTIGLEMARQTVLADVDTIIVPAGGGGLVAGVATAVLSVNASLSVYAAEPSELDDTARSLRAGQRVENAVSSHSICDALRSPTPGLKTFSVNRRLLSGGLTASDSDVMRAMALAFQALKVVVEPGGAVALAAALVNPDLLRNRVTIVVASGGNVDAVDYSKILEASNTPWLKASSI